MKKRSLVVGIIVLLILLALGIKYSVHAGNYVDLTGNLLLKFPKDIDEANLYKDIKFVDEDNNEVPVLLNAITKREVVAVPMYDMSSLKIKLSSTYEKYSIEKYRNQAFVGTQENLRKLSVTMRDYPMEYGIALKEMPSGTGPVAQSDTANLERATNSAYSQTNVQVEGIDEGDMIKTDGKYLYYLNGMSLQIIKAEQGKMELCSKIKNDWENFSPEALYVEKERLILIGHSFNGRFPKTKCVIYDINDRKNPKLERSIEQEGYYFDSRKKGSKLYLFSSRHLYEGIDMKLEYKDSLKSDQIREISPKEIMIFPGCARSSLIVLSSVDIDGSAPSKITSLVGGQDELYMSEDNIYLSYQERRYQPFIMPAEQLNRIADQNIRKIKERTNIKKFEIKNDDIRYQSEATIDGWVLNQFSMDEKNGYFRVAYTGDRMEYKKGSSLAVFDKDMKRVGLIEHIAPGERIYSVRFMGDKAYMVTFKNVDPFFVLDLKDPKSPKMLGYLKIPGVSHYLHPYDENTVIGIGTDTVNNSKNTAFYLGMKISLFDVTDVSNPIEKDVEKIGDRGTSSEVLYNHRVLLYDAKRGLLGFPVSVTQVKGNRMNEKYEFPEYGEEVFQGAYLYKVSKNSIGLKGRVTHMPNFNPYHFDYEDRVKRMMYIGDVLYTLSGNKVMATDMNTMKMMGELSLK